MRTPQRVDVVHLFPEERARLLELLGTLQPEDWVRPTVCPGWSVADIARHILGDDLARLSSRRDGYVPLESANHVPAGQRIAQFNEEWIVATRRLSSRVVGDLLRVTGEWLFAYFGTLDLDAVGRPVSWAGPQNAPVWLDIAREYTERWHHQQQIRDAVGALPLTAPHLFGPVLATFAYALPHTFREHAAPEGTTVQLHIEGDAGGDWTVRREAGEWRLYRGSADTPAAQVRLPQDVAWRLFTRGITPDQAEVAAELTGDRRLGRTVLDAVGVLV